MVKSSVQWKVILPLIAALAFILACGVSITPADQAQPSFDPTKAALEYQATAMALQMTQAALNAQQQQSSAPTQEPTLPPPTAPQPTTPPEPTQIPASPTPDLEAQMKSAKILLFEDTTMVFNPWIKDALNGLGLQYTDVSGYMGHFMTNLNSGTDWDLIIVGAEAKSDIRGEFWDVINTQVNNRKAAVIAEIWYLDLYNDRALNLFLSNCGIAFQADWQVAESIYWLVPDHPVFNEPYTAVPLIHYNRAWQNQAGDRIRLTGSGDATMLAGLYPNEKSQEGVMATCYGGRVIVQTFSNHDYRYNEVITLWENYIHYVLKNHFAVDP